MADPTSRRARKGEGASKTKDAKKKAAASAPAAPGDSGDRPAARPPGSRPANAKASTSGASAGRRQIYFDANSTGFAPPDVVDTVTSWMNRGNPSSGYAAAAEIRDMFDKFSAQIAAVGGFALSDFRVIYTSGASESNNHIVTAAVRGFLAKRDAVPHLVISAAEHWSLLACARQLESEGLATVTCLPVETDPTVAGFGAVRADDLARELEGRPDTCLVAIMAANNETGVISDLKPLAALAHEFQVPFYTDAAQVYGRAALRPEALGLDAFGASFHKLGGPPGVGLLVIREQFAEGYGLPPLICGTQNGGFRGGTENVPGIAGACVAFRLALADRPKKNAAVRLLRDRIWTGIRRYHIGLTYAEYRDPAKAATLKSAAKGDQPIIVWITPPSPEQKLLPNTMLLAVVRAHFCNVKARMVLEKHGIIVSVGSACNTLKPEASHVVTALELPPELRRGVLRVSIPDSASNSDVDQFAAVFADVAGGSAAILAR